MFPARCLDFANAANQTASVDPPLVSRGFSEGEGSAVRGSGGRVSLR